LRLNGQNRSLKCGKLLRRKKEKCTMLIKLLKAALVLSMLFVATGATVALAASSPDSPINSIGLDVERIFVDWGIEPQGEAFRQLSMAQERVREIIRLAENGQESEEALRLQLQLQLQLQEHLQQTMKQAAQLGDQEMQGVLTRTQAMLQTQLQLLNQAQERLGEQAGEPIGQAIQVMAQVHEQVQAGLQDPDAFRQRARTGQFDELPEAQSVSAAENCVPVGDEHKYGPNADQPGPGGPGGNPDCPSDDCEPVGDANQYGPQPEQPGPGQPGGNPDCTACVPVGDQNMYGEPPADPGNGGTGGSGGMGGSGGRR
jgi:hypothetical protein